MSIFGSIAQSIGSTGNDFAQAQFSLQDLKRQIAQAKLKDLMDQLQLQEGQQRIAASKQQQAMQTPEGVRNFLKGALGRDPTDDEVRSYLQIAPKMQIVTGEPIPGESIGRTPGTWWRAETQGGQVTGYVPSGAPKPGATKGDVIKDPTSSTGTSKVYRNPDGSVASTVKNYVDPSMATTVQQGYAVGYDPVTGDMILVPKTTTSSKAFPGQGGGGAPRKTVDLGPPKPSAANASKVAAFKVGYDAAQRYAANPTADNSLALASLADKLLGTGTAHVKAMSMIEKFTGFTKEHAAAILKEISDRYQEMQNQSGAPAGAPPGAIGNVTVDAP